MASKEMQLISRVVYTGDLNTVLDWGITSEDMLTNEGRAMYNHILGYYSQADSVGSVIGPQAMTDVYTAFSRCDDEGMTTPALCLEVRRERLAIEGLNAQDNIREMFAHDPLEAINMMHALASKLSNIGTGRNLDVTLGQSFDRLLTKYQMKKDGIDMSCGPWPWEVMNNVTGGFQEDDYIVFYGRPKSFKSWVLAYIIAWIFNQNKKGLIYTKEMTPDNIFMRVIACIAEISYHNFRMALLSHDEEQALYAAHQYIAAMEASQNLICLSGQDAPEGGDSVPWLRSKVEKYEPDFIFIDGLYLMSDIKKAKKDNERVRNISRDLRQMNLSLKIPLIATLQANREAAKHEEANLDEIAFSDGIGQDATAIIRVINEKGSPTCQLVMGGAREYELNGFRINAVPAQDFTYHGAVTAKEIKKAERDDSLPEDNPEAHAVKKVKKRKPRTETRAADEIAKRIENM
jgi:hypothetical protein